MSNRNAGYGNLWMLIAVLAGLSAQRVVASDVNDLSACNSEDFQTVTQPSGKVDARAVWLNRSTILWPGIGAAGKSSRIRLYYSATRNIAAKPGARVEGADGMLALGIRSAALAPGLAARFKYLGEGTLFDLPALSVARLRQLQTKQLILVREDGDGIVIDATATQAAGALDDLFSAAETTTDLGATVSNPGRPGGTRFKLWAPTARAVSVCLYDSARTEAKTVRPMSFDASTGIWHFAERADRSQTYYTYLVDVFVRGVGWVRNRVTDPYSISLSADSRRSYVANLNAPSLKPAGWNTVQRPTTVAAITDMVIYELHVRDFSINDSSVSTANRGKYLAFAESVSNGMKHLRALSSAGLTDVHLLPVFDIASIPEGNCITPKPQGSSAGEEQQALVGATAAEDCYNWGYDPLHYTAPEGSYASDAENGSRRIIEFRQMVQALHRANLRVGMDVVYNHTPAAGQHKHSVLDRIVPGYYQRLGASGEVETSTCCSNTATENRMMAKLMIDSVVTWARDYHIDSFRFDLMGHQPRDAMERLQKKLHAVTGREIQLIGEGWNFGEVASGARFVQASQLALNGSGIGTFSDRARDAVRGGSASDSGENLVKRQGYINGFGYAPNLKTESASSLSELRQMADLVRVGLAGSIRSYVMQTYLGSLAKLEEIDYNGQPAGYASQPSEVVNYIENHDNQTLFDVNALRLPQQTNRQDRARVQMLGAAINAFSQGVAYFHAGVDTLRSKSFDRNSYDSGDWFNRLDWTYQDNYFGTGLPPAGDNAQSWAVMRPLLDDSSIKPTPTDIAWARDVFQDLLKIRASSSLFRLRSASEIAQRLNFFNTGPDQVPTVLAARLNGEGYPGANFNELVYLVNVDQVEHRVQTPDLSGHDLSLHPVHLAATAADQRVTSSARFDSATGSFIVPARTAVVFVGHSRRSAAQL